MDEFRNAIQILIIQILHVGVVFLPGHLTRNITRPDDGESN